MKRRLLAICPRIELGGAREVIAADDASATVYFCGIPEHVCSSTYKLSLLMTPTLIPFGPACFLYKYSVILFIGMLIHEYAWMESS